MHEKLDGVKSAVLRERFSRRDAEMFEQCLDSLNRRFALIVETTNCIHFDAARFREIEKSLFILIDFEFEFLPEQFANRYFACHSCSHVSKKLNNTLNRIRH